MLPVHFHIVVIFDHSSITLRSLWIYTMNRCSSPFSTALLVAALALALAPFASLAQTTSTAQATAAPVYLPQRIPPISPRAQRGVLRIVQPPEVLLNKQPARLAPGARIRGRNNLITMSASLMGEDLPVRYTRDPLGLVHEVWVLTAEEAALDPMPQLLSPPPENWPVRRDSPSIPPDSRRIV